MPTWTVFWWLCKQRCTLQSMLQLSTQRLLQDVSSNQKVKATELNYIEDTLGASSNNKIWKTSVNGILSNFTHIPIYTSVTANSTFRETRDFKRRKLLRKVMPHRMSLQKSELEWVCSFMEPTQILTSHTVIFTISFLSHKGIIQRNSMTTSLK